MAIGYAQPDLGGKKRFLVISYNIIGSGIKQKRGARTPSPKKPKKLKIPKNNTGDEIKYDNQGEVSRRKEIESDGELSEKEDSHVSKEQEKG